MNAFQKNNYHKAKSLKKEKISNEKGKTLLYLYGLQTYGIKFGLAKTSNILKAFGNPHLGRKYIHIGGTNGKGSVAAMVESMLLRAGLNVGFFSSPHLVHFTERFRINGEQVAPEKIVRIVEDLKRVIDPDHLPTFFEVTTAMALILFAREDLDISIMEVGMGGRLDATNIITPLVSVITNISLEHQNFLGSRLVDIAGEKAGIIKNGVDLVTGANQAPVVKAFESICREKEAPFWRVGKDFRYRTHATNFNYYGLKRSFKNIELSLRGKFQCRNATLALAVMELLEKKGVRFSTQDLLDGLKSTHWPGRMQVIAENPLIILDGGHNPAAIKKLSESVRDCFTYKRLILVLGVMEDKDIKGITEGIVPMADYVIYTRPDYYRSAKPEKIMSAAAVFQKEGEIQPSIPSALDKAGKIADPEDMILICGSLFTVGEALTCLDAKTYPVENI